MTPTLSGWHLQLRDDPRGPLYCVVGTVHGHPSHPDGSSIRTSAVLYWRPSGLGPDSALEGSHPMQVRTSSTTYDLRQARTLDQWLLVAEAVAHNRRLVETTEAGWPGNR